MLLLSRRMIARSGLCCLGLTLLSVAAAARAATVTWVGDGANNYWDTSSVVWDSNGDGVADAAYSNGFGFGGDDVVFTDTGSTEPWVRVDGILSPASLTFDVTSASYLLTSKSTSYNADYLSGAMGISKLGSGRVHVDLGNNGTLADNFSGDVNIYAGTLVADRIGSLGNATGITRIHNGATLDIIGTNVTAETIYVQGAGVDVDSDGIGDGALYNGFNTRLAPTDQYYRLDQSSAFKKVTFEGDTTIGGVARMDIKDSALVANGHDLTIKMTGKDVAPDDPDCSYFVLNNMTITDLANIYVERGIFSVNRTRLGITTDAVVLGTGSPGTDATLRMYQLNPTDWTWEPGGGSVEKNIVANGGGILAGMGNNFWYGSVTLNVDLPVDVPTGMGINLYNNASGEGVIGAAGLAKLGGGTLTLEGTNTYAGDTTISAGTLALGTAATLSGTSTINVGVDSFFDVSALTGGFVMGGSQTLKGDGTVTGSVTTAAGSHVAPGDAVGSLSITGNLDLAGILDVEYDGSTDVVDLLEVASTLDLGGATISLSGTGSLANGTYVFATYGSLSGNPATELGLPAGWSINYLFDHDGGGTPDSIALIVTGAAQIPGDTDGDADVDADDAAVLAQNWGGSVSNGADGGDFNGDGVVNATDASILAANWGNHAAEGAAAVPEPGTLGLVLLGLAGLAVPYRRGRQR